MEHRFSIAAASASGMGGTLRIVHVSDCFAPRTGGIETHLKELTEAQAARGHDVHVFTSEVGPHGEAHGSVERMGGVTVHRLGTPMPLNAPWSPMGVIRANRRLERLAPDVVHAHAGIVCPLAMGTAKQALVNDVPLAVTWHSVADRSWPLTRSWARSVGRSVVSAAFSAVSVPAALPVEKALEQPVRILHNGVDQDRWSPVEEPAKVPPPLRLVATGRLVPKKRVGDLIRAVGHAVAQLPTDSLTLDVFGEGPDRRRLTRMVERLDLSPVVAFHGATGAAELVSRYRGAHVFCAPSPREAFGIAALEGRSTGLVLLGRRGTGVEEFARDGVDSVLVGDTGAMAEALVELVTDHEWFTRLWRAARTQRPDFGYDRVVDDTFDEYQRARSLSGRPLAHHAGRRDRS